MKSMLRGLWVTRLDRHMAPGLGQIGERVRPTARAALWLTLLVIPDSRADTRTRILRGVALMARDPACTLSDHQVFKLTRDLGRAQRWYVITGVALYRHTYQHYLATLLFVVAGVSLPVAAIMKLIALL